MNTSLQQNLPTSKYSISLELGVRSLELGVGHLETMI
jgi:hypothetical protein